ncbi:uncharacterized protein LOC119176364 isoform X4 [Rhipicephalus microplus]|uniref:uncharacterized protein LOC119176364 isoform X4 n=1 Tax=Rhipicephalus microplus TaxID=6941 RepID=UPI003F6CDC97
MAPPQQWRGQDLLRIMGDSERNASSADDPECAPSDLLDLMIAWKAKIRLQIDRDLQVGGQHQAKNEQPDGMQYIIDVLLDQNEQLVCSLVELEREALKRTAQMQKRLQSTAITTRETVKKMSEWGEQIKDLISKKELAEHATLEYKYEAADLKRENEQLRNYNDNLYSDIQSLLSIIDVARKTGNWEMDCVTFCVISPEEVYGPICRPSAQNSDCLGATTDLKPDLLESLGTQCAAAFSESLPAMITVGDKRLAVQEAPKFVDSSFRTPLCKVKPRNVRRRLFETAKKRSTPKHSVRYKHLSASTVKRKGTTTKLYGEIHAPTCAFSSTVEDINTQVLLNVSSKHDQNSTSSQIHPLLVCTGDQRKSPHTDVESKGTTVFRESLPDVFPGCGTNVAIQGISESVESFLRLPSCKVKSRNVRRHLYFGSAKKLSAPEHNVYDKHLNACPAKRNEAATKSYGEVQAQTCAVPLAVEDMKNQVLVKVSSKHDKNKASSHIHPLLVPTDDQRETSRADVKSECATNFRESLSAVLPIRDESVAIQDAPKSVKRKVKSRNVRRRLVFETARKVFAPKHNTDYKHFSVKRKVGKMKSCAEDGVQTSSVAVPITEYYAEFGTGVFPTSSALKDIGTQVDLPSFLKKNEEGKSSLSAVLLPTEDEKKSMAVTSTQTDVQWETCIPSGNEKRDLELCCLREHLTLALEEAQSKALLAMDLQLHLDRSAKEVELRDQVVNNLEKKLSAARQQTDNLKKQQTSVECELESVRSLLRKEKAESQQYLLKLEKMAITVKHLQDALVECKKTVGAASAAVEPKVHDV